LKGFYINNLKRKKMLNQQRVTPESTERSEQPGSQRFLRNVEFMKTLFKDLQPSLLGEDISKTMVEGKPISINHNKAVKRYKTNKQQQSPLHQNCLLFPEAASIIER